MVMRPSAPLMRRTIQPAGGLVGADQGPRVPVAELPPLAGFTTTVMEDLRGRVAFTAAGASPFLTAPIQRIMFADNLGQANGSGGLTLVAGDANLFGGIIPSNEAYDLYDLELNVVGVGGVIVDEDEKIALGESVVVSMAYSGQSYDLGYLMDWYGPAGGSLEGASRRQFSRKFGPYGVRRVDGSDAGIFPLRPGQPFGLVFTLNRTVTANLTASVVYNVTAKFSVKKYLQGSAAQKQ